MRLRATLYRALNPYWAYRPLSGEGAAMFGGRFNRVGRAALYLAEWPETALHEVNQAGAFQPVTLVACAADLDPVLDATDPEALARFGVVAADLAIPDWAMLQDMQGRAPTQDLAEAVIEAGYCGMIVPSYAPGAAAGARNVVLWDWDAPQALRVIDDAGRLRHPPAPPDRA